MNNSQPVLMKHYIGIDAIRFLAALLVMYYHYGYFLAVGLKHSYPASVNLLSFPELAPFSYFGFIGVQIFFVISGFVIAFSGEKAPPFKFMVSRIVRLGPGVWICATLTLTAMMLESPPNFEDFRLYLNSLLFVPFGSWIDGVYWTLGIEIAFYFFVWILIKMNRFSLIRELAIVVGTLSFFFWVANIFGLTGASHQQTSQVASVVVQTVNWTLTPTRIMDLMLMHHGMYFALGVFLWLELTKESKPSNIAWCIFFIVAGCLQIYAQVNSLVIPHGVNSPHLIAIIIWLVVMGVLVSSVKLNKYLHRVPQALLRTIRTAGLMTFPIYLLHQVAGIGVMRSLSRLGINRWSVLVMGVLLTLFVAWFVATKLEPHLQTFTKNWLIKHFV